MTTGKKAYFTTSVPPERTQAEIRKVLKAAGCGDIGYREEDSKDGHTLALVAEFTSTQEGLQFGYRVKVPFRVGKVDRKRSESWAQAEAREIRRLWRVLYWQIVRRLEAIEEGVSEWHQEFGSDIVDPVTNLTVWETMQRGKVYERLALGGPGMLLLGSG